MVENILDSSPFTNTLKSYKVEKKFWIKCWIIIIFLRIESKLGLPAP